MIILHHNNKKEMSLSSIKKTYLDETERISFLSKNRKIDPIFHLSIVTQELVYYRFQKFRRNIFL